MCKGDLNGSTGKQAIERGQRLQGPAKVARRYCFLDFVAPDKNLIIGQHAINNKPIPITRVLSDEHE
jgi:hypothetical protein